MLDQSGNVLIADANNSRIREVNRSTGVITTIAGNGTEGYNGDNIPATQAELNEPEGIALDAAGDLFIAEYGSQRIREVNASTGTITTIAGDGTQRDSGDGGLAVDAELNTPFGLAFDSSGDLYVSEYAGDRVREINSSTGVITTVAGGGQSGLGNGGPATSAELSTPAGISFDSANNLFIADEHDNMVREVSAATGIITTFAGSTISAGFGGDGGTAASAQLAYPFGVALDANGNVFIADSGNNRIREVSASTGDISTVAGGGSNELGDGGPATAATLSDPGSVLPEANGSFLIADSNDNRIREVGGTFGANVPPGSGATATSDLLKNKSTCNCGELPVNAASGDFWHAFTDVSVPGRGPGLDLTRTYNSSLASVEGRFGWGWNDSYEMAISVDQSGNPTVHSDDGSSATATLNPDGSYSVPSWADSTLVKHADGTWTFDEHQVTTYGFDATGRLSSISDLNGYATVLTYNGGGQLQSVTDAANRALSYTYGANGLVQSVQDPSGKLVQYGYDAAGDLTGVTDQLGRSYGFSYDANHLMTAMTEPTGGQVQNTYDTSGRVVQQRDPAGLTTTYAYAGDNFSATGGTTTITDSHGNVEVQAYTNGELLSLTKGANSASPSKWLFSYDPVTLGQTQVTDPNGNVTKKTFDQDGNVTSVDDPLNYQSTVSYNQFSEPLVETDAVGITTSYVYDSAGNLQSKTITGVGGSPVQTTTYGYGDSRPGDITKVLDPAGRETDYAYDAFGDVASITTHPSAQQADTTAFVSDVLGRRVCQASPNATAAGVVCPAAGQPPVSDTTTWTYDADSEVLSSSDPLGHTTAYAYELTPGSDARCPASVAGASYCDVTTDPMGSVTTTWYDADGRTLAVTSGEGSPLASTTTRGYDLPPVNPVTAGDSCLGSVSVDAIPVSYCTTSADALGNVTTDYYDTKGELIEEQQPTTGTTTNSYDSASNLLASTTAGGTSTYGYDADNRVTSITYSSPTSGFAAAPNVSYKYDADGQRTQTSDGTGTTLYGRDSLERLQSVTDGAGATVTYGYDLDNEQTCISYPLVGAATCQSATPPSGLGVVTRSYDGAGEVSSVTDWQGNTTHFSYDDDGNLEQTNLPNGISSATKYFADDTVKSISDTTGSSSVATMSYSRTADGQVSSETDTSLPGPASQDYSYDQITRLASDSSGTYGYNQASDLTGLSNGATLTPSSVTQELESMASPITEVGSPTSASGALGVSSVPLPSGIAPYDQILVAVMELNTQSVSTPTGFTAVGTYGTGGSGAVQVQLFRRTAAGGETSVALSYPSGAVKGPTVAMAAVYRGVDAAQPLDGQSGGSSSTSSVGAGSITTTLANDELVLFQGAAEATDSSGFSPPTGMTELAQSAETPVAGALAAGTARAPGATGTKTSAWNGVDTTLAAAMVALRPSVTTYSYDALGDRTSSATPGRPTASYGYDQLGRMVSSGSATSYVYDGGGLRVSKASGTGTESYTWDVSGAQPLVLVDGTTNYVYGPDGLPLEQLQSPNITLVASGSGSSVPAQGSITASFSKSAQLNDQIVVAVSEDTGETASIAGYAPIGAGTWTGSEDRLQLFHKTATGGESSVAVLVTAATGDVHSVAVSAAVYRGVDPFVPIDTQAVASQIGAAGAASVTVPGVSPSAPSEQLLLFQGAATTATALGVEGSWSAPGMTEETQGADSALTAASGTADLSLAGNSPPASQSTSVATLPTASAVSVIGALVALRPIEPYYYLHDQLGSTRVVTTQVGGTLATSAYAPYGELLGATGAAQNPFGFAGSYSDNETGLMYLQNRFYDPTTGQFLSVDPALDATGQPYAYASGDPVNETDPTGLYGYKYTFDLGHGEAPQSYLADLQYDINGVFPFGVQTMRGQWVGAAQGGLQCGQEYLINTFGYHNPVLVTGLTDTSLTFESLPGHAEGSGNFITFSFFYGAKTGDTYFRVQANGPTQWFDHIPLIEGGRQNLAHALWADLASNLASFIPNQA